VARADISTAARREDAGGGIRFTGDFGRTAILRRSRNRLKSINPVISRRTKRGERDLKKIALLAVVLLLFVQTIDAIELPKPPSGFTWQEVPELKAAFLKPDGWFFKQETKKGTLAYFITQEDLAKTNEFSTGLSLNVIHPKNDSAVERGKDMIDQMAVQHQVKSWSRQFGPFQEFGCELKDTDASGTVVMHALNIANPKTNVLYIFTFESPAANWEAAWKIGQQMMEALALDDEI